MASLEQLLCDIRRTSPKGGAAPSAVIEKVREWKGMGESMLNSLATSLLAIDSREEKLNLASEALEAQWKSLKEKERQLELLDEGKREALKFMEEKLKSKEEDLDKQLKSKEEDLDKQLKSVSEEIESLEVEHDEVFRLKIKEREKLKEIEKREKELDMMIRSADERLGEIKKRETEFDAYRDEKSRDLTLKEEVLVREKREFDEKIRLMSEEIKEKQKAGSGVIIEMSKSAQNSVYRMKGFLDDKFKEIESWEMMTHKSLYAKLNEAELLQESVEKRFKELEDIEKKLNVSQDDKTKTLESKEGQVGTVEIDRVKLRGEKLTEQQKLGHQILDNNDDEKKRELELKQVNSVSCEMEHGYKEQDCREKSLSSEKESAQTCIKAKLASTKLDHLRGVELKQRLQGPEQPTSTTEEIDKVKLRGEKLTEQQKSGLQILENKDDEKKRELELKRVNLVSCEMEHDYKEQDCREKSLSSEKESAQTCVKAKLASTNLDHLRGVELKQRLRGLDQPKSTTATNVHSSTNQDKSVDLTGALLNDKMTLEMVINGPEKDPELMGSWISEILSRSSDPAKVVLDTVEVFYTNCSGKLDTECKQRGRTILMLDKLAILSPNIQPFVTEAAIKLAYEWKSRMGSPMKNPMEALVFLNLVAAYKLSFHFDQEELFRLLMAAAKHKQTPVICHTLGLLPRIPGYIQKLIHEKKFLLASTFVYEYQFQDRFPQAAILNNYTAHARFTANKCRGKHNNLQGQKMAVGNEIAALRLAIKHISQYGLESEYPPNALAARIKQLEGTQASLRRRTPSPSAGQMPKQGKGWQKRYREARLAQVVLDEGGESLSFPLNPQMAVPRQGSSGCAWTPKHQAMSQRETGGSSNPRPRVPEYSVPGHRHMGPYKRRRTDLWMNGGGLPVAQFVSSQY